MGDVLGAKERSVSLCVVQSVVHILDGISFYTYLHTGHGIDTLTIIYVCNLTPKNVEHGIEWPCLILMQGVSTIHWGLLFSIL